MISRNHSATKLYVDPFSSGGHGAGAFLMVTWVPKAKAIWRWRRKIARRGILATLLMTTLLAGGCAYNGYYTDYPYYGDYYPYPYGGYYPSYGFSGGFLIRQGGHYGKHFGHGGGGHRGGHH